MEINKIPVAFIVKLRLSIISALIVGDKTFKQLKILTEATAGNLGAQLEKLEEWGYIVVIKEFKNKRSLSTYSLTEKGIKEFKEYVEMLNSIVKQSRYN